MKPYNLVLDKSENNKGGRINFRKKKERVSVDHQNIVSHICGAAKMKHVEDETFKRDYASVRQSYFHRFGFLHQ